MDMMNLVCLAMGGALVLLGFLVRGWTDRTVRERPIEVLTFPPQWKTSRKMDLGEIIVDKVVREYRERAKDERKGQDSGRVGSARTEEAAGSRG